MSEPPHQIFYDWAQSDILDSCIDPSLFLADVDLSGLGCGFNYAHDGFNSQPRATQSITYESDYSHDNLGQCSEQLAWPSSKCMLQLEGIRHDQNIANEAFPNFGDESHAREPPPCDMDTLDVSAPHAEYEDPKNPEKSGCICATCGVCFLNENRLFWHKIESGHLPYQCEVAGCNKTFRYLDEREVHQKREHILGHGLISTATPHECAQCKKPFQSNANLLQHGKESQHHPYACECGTFFSRLDVLNRHLDSFGTGNPMYPCRYCKRHRGADGFRRKDHLMQHIRNYHHHEVDETGFDALQSSKVVWVFPVCSHEDCPQYRDAAFKQLPHSIQDKNKPFSSLSAYTKHMREEHGESPYPCDVSGCSRIGRRGYFREKDLLKHRSKEHPDAPPYPFTKREARHLCTGCGKHLAQSSLQAHFSWSCPALRQRAAIV